MVVVASKIELENREKKLLAPYAILSSATRGREFSEKPDPTRTEFQRDRDRIIHSKAFRRLSGKTQVFVATYGDHFRDRLSHTLEVAQIARDLARNLRLNEDLCEAISLAHDLGHTPFGHAGEATLNKIMQKFSLHFEHNEQSKRIVEVLEKQFPHFDGLNLTYEVRQGLAKHQTFYDQRGKPISGKSLEVQVVDIADEIAYHNHDVDDGLRSALFDFHDLRRLAIFCKACAAVSVKHGERLSGEILKSRTVSQLISFMIQDVLKETARRLRRFNITTVRDVLRCKQNIVQFSPAFLKEVEELRVFLWQRMYQSKEVLHHSQRGQKILEKLFWKLYKKPKLLPKRFYERIDAPDTLEIAVKDFVAGCTDVYAEELLDY